MAIAKKPAGPLVVSSRQAQKEAAAQFRSANKQRSEARTLLSPQDVEGEYDAGRLLFTTLGGQVRPLTFNDLKEFQHNIRTLRSKYKKGIKPKDVINLSLPIDRERAHKEINAALPLNVRAGQLRFVTNAGPNSDVKRHYVNLVLLNFEAAVISPVPVDKIVKDVVTGPCAFSCDCGRWRYWYAFLATTGGYNAGHREGAYPKVRNPELHGVACKHVLRVMVQLTQSPTTKVFISKLIEKERNEVERKKRVVTQKEMKALHGDITKERWDKRAVRTSQEKAAVRAKTPSAIARQAKAAQNKADKLTLQQARQKGIDAALAQAERAMRNIPGMSDAAISAALMASRKEMEKAAKK